MWICQNHCVWQGICNIYDEVVKLTDKPVTAVATHIHWDHIGGHKYFQDFYAHEEELDWLSGKFPLSMETVRNMVVDCCELPKGYDVSSYEMFQGRPTRVLHDGERIDLGGRVVNVFHTPGHSPGHMCFWEAEIIGRMRDSFRELKERGKLHHGSGTYDYGDWAVWL